MEEGPFRNWWFVLFPPVLLVGYGLAGQPRAPPKRADGGRKRTMKSMKEESRRKGMEWINGMKWIYWWNQMLMESINECQWNWWAEWCGGEWNFMNKLIYWFVNEVEWPAEWPSEASNNTKRILFLFVVDWRSELLLLLLFSNPWNQSIHSIPQLGWNWIEFDCFL